MLMNVHILSQIGLMSCSREPALGVLQPAGARGQHWPAKAYSAVVWCFLIASLKLYQPVWKVLFTRLVCLQKLNQGRLLFPCKPAELFPLVAFQMEFSI